MRMNRLEYRKAYGLDGLIYKIMGGSTLDNFCVYTKEYEAFAKEDEKLANELINDNGNGNVYSYFTALKNGLKSTWVAKTLKEDEKKYLRYYSKKPTPKLIQWRIRRGEFLNAFFSDFWIGSAEYKLNEKLYIAYRSIGYETETSNIIKVIHEVSEYIMLNS